MNSIILQLYDDVPMAVAARRLDLSVQNGKKNYTHALYNVVQRGAKETLPLFSRRVSRLLAIRKSVKKAPANSKSRESVPDEPPGGGGERFFCATLYTHARTRKITAYAMSAPPAKENV